MPLFTGHRNHLGRTFSLPGLLRRYHPRTIHPLAIKAMAEVGIDISEAAGHHSKTIEEFAHQPPMDLVVTVCDEAAEECPYFPHARRQEHWGFPDPSAATGTAEERLAVFRQVGDAIEARIGLWLTQAVVSFA